MIKKIVLVAAFLMALVSTTANKSYAVSPTGQGIFIVSNCNTIVAPVTNGSYCLVGTTISVWNGSAWVSTGGAGGGPINTLPAQTGNYNNQGFKSTNAGAPSTTGDVLSWGNVAQLASLVIGSPTGGNEGAGTINATNVFINGVAVSTSGGPINTLPSQTGTYNAQGFSFTNLLSIIAHSIIQYANNATNALLGFSINGTYNPVAYGADPTGSADSIAALQAAEVSAALSSSTFAPKIAVPVGKYKITRPFVLQNSSLPASAQVQGILEGAGAGATIFAPTFAGPAIVTASDENYPSVVGVSITSNIIPSGSGSSMTVAAGSGPWGTTEAGGQFDLSEVLPPTISNTGNGGYFNGSSQWDIQFFFQDDDTTKTRCLAASTGTWNTVKNTGGDVGGGGMYYFCVESDGKVHAMMNIAGTLHKLTGTATVTQGAVYEGELNYDGSNINLYYGNGGTITRQAQVTGLSGVITQRGDENQLLLGASNNWPLLGLQNEWKGKVQSIRMSNVARNTGANFTQDTANFTSDANTKFLWNFDLTQFPIPSGMTNGLPIAQVDTPSNGWLALHNLQDGCCGSSYKLSGFNVAGSQTVGIFANATTVNIDNVLPSSPYIEIELSSAATYTSSISNVYSAGGGTYTGIMALGGITKLSNIVVDVGAYNVLLKGGYADNIFITENKVTECGMGLIGGSDPISVTKATEDAENGDFNSFPAICVRAVDTVNNPIQVSNSFLQLGGTHQTSYVQLIGFIHDLKLTNNSFSDPGAVALNQPIVDGTYATIGNNALLSPQVTFDSNTYDVVSNPTLSPGHNAYVSGPVSYNAVNEYPTQFNHLAVQTLPQPIPGVTTKNCSSATTCAVNTPKGGIPGDVEIAALGWTGGGSMPGTITIPSGWTLACTANNSANNYYTAMYYHVAGPNEPSTYTWSWTTSATLNASVVPFIGVNAANPVSLCQPTVVNTAPPATIAGGTASDQNVGAWVFAPIQYANPSISSPPVGGYIIGSANANTFLGFFYYPQSTTVPTITVAGTTAGFDHGAAIQIALNPALAGAKLGGEGSPVLFQNMGGAGIQNLVVSNTANYAVAALGFLNGFSQDGHYNPVAYGADPTDTADSMPAEQAAADAACANSPSFFGGKVGATVVWPVGAFKSVSSPLLVSCDATIGFSGAGVLATVLDSQGGAPNMGPGIVEVPVAFPPRINPITATSLATGTGTDFSMNWGVTGSQNNYFYNISTVWEAGGTAINNPLNGLSAETIRFFIKPLQHGSDANGTIYGISHMDNELTDLHPNVKLLITWTYGSGGTSTITFCQSTTGNPSPTSSNGPPPKCITGNITNSVVNYVEYNFDGSLHLATGLPGGTATFVSAVTSSGTLINAQDDDFDLGISATDPAQWMSGQIDSFEVSKVVRHAQGSGSFTAPTAKFTSDSNTIWLANNQSVKNINVNGVTPYVFAIKATTGAGWLVPFGADPPSGGGIQSIDNMTIKSGFTLNESLSSGLEASNTNFSSGYFGGYYGYSQAYNSRFNNVGFGNFNTLYQLRMDGNSFGTFNNLSFSSGYYLIIGTGGGTFTNIFEQIGSGTIVANTFLGKGDLFTGDDVDYLSTDAEEGGCAVAIGVGGGLSRFTLDHSAFQPAGCGSPGLQIAGTPPQRMTIKNTGIFGNIQFDNFSNSASLQPGLGSEPVQLDNDYTASGPIGTNSASVCVPYQDACQIVGANTQFSRLGIQTGPPTPMGYLENNIGSTSVVIHKDNSTMSGDMYVLTITFLGATPDTGLTIPTGWTQDTVCSAQDTSLGGTSVAYVRTFHHKAEVSDPSTWTFSWTNAEVGQYLDTIYRGADETNPIDTCFTAHGNTTTTVTLTGGTSTNINDVVENYVGFYAGFGTTMAVGATPPSNLAPIVQRGTFGNQAYWYTPGSLTIPTVNYTLSASNVQFAALQIAIRSKTQSSNVLGTTSSVGVLFQGMNGATLQGATAINGGLINSTGNTPPTATFADGTHCGASGSFTSGATNIAGQITIGTTNPTTVCPIVFATNFTAAPTVAPICNAQDESTFQTLKVTTTTTALTITAATDMHGDVIHWTCIGKGN